MEIKILPADSTIHPKQASLVATNQITWLSALGTAHRQACRLGWRHVFTQPLQTLTTTLVLATTFALLLLVWSLWHNLGGNNTAWQRNFAVTLYLQPTISKVQSHDLLAQLKARPDVADAHYISPAQGLAELQQQLKMDNAPSLLEPSLLPGVIVLQPATPSPEAIQQLGQTLQQLPEVSETQFDLQWVKQLAAWRTLGVNLGYLLSGLLLISLWGGMYYAIQAALAPKPQELRWYQVLGASDGFIRRPFLYAGVWYGLIGALGGIVLFILLEAILSASLVELANLYHVTPQGLTLTAALVLLLASVLLGWVSAWLVLSKELDTASRL